MALAIAVHLSKYSVPFAAAEKCQPQAQANVYRDRNRIASSTAYLTIKYLTRAALLSKRSNPIKKAIAYPGEG